MKVFINAGHDLKYDSGAINKTYSITEAQIVRSVADKVAYYLRLVGYDVRIAQSDNLYFDSFYAERQAETPVCVASNNWPADIFVSLHCNAFNTKASGTETLIYQTGFNSEILASCIQRQLIDTLHTVNRGVKEAPQLTVLRRTNAPAVLVEIAFIDNNADALLLINNQDDISRSISRGITDYAAKIQKQ